jgi:hypothetical protein
MSEVKCMNDNRKIIVAVSVLVVVAMVVCIAVANAYYSSAQATPYGGYEANYGQYGYNVPYGQAPPSNVYGPYGSQTPYGSGYSYYSGMGGMGRMGVYGMGMMR